MQRPQQTTFDFGIATSAAADGLHAWREEHRKQRAELSKSLGLPIGKQVEVWLRGGIRLRGALELAEEALIHTQITSQNVRLQVSGVPFLLREMESCVEIEA